MLALREVRKRFGAVEAVAGVDFDLAPGEVVGLIGPNGSGKSTLMGLISGLYTADGGTILFDGHRVDRMTAYRRRRLGIAQTFQVTRPVTGMTVLENAMVGALFAGSRPSRRQAIETAHRVLAQVGLQGREGLTVGMLPVQDLKRLELARALASAPRLLLLDEVLAGIGDEAIDAFRPLIRAAVGQGQSVVMVEHRVTLLFRVVDRVVVLHEGRKIAEGPPRAIAADPVVVSAYLGHEYARRLLEADA
jgi:branched-chain amino acid transport system ATP-binding protein